MNPKVLKAFLLALCLFLAAGCANNKPVTNGVGETGGTSGGPGSGVGNGGSSGGGHGGGGGGGGGGGVTTPTPVSVAAQQNTPGINITVAAPASNPTPNIEFLGVDSNGAAFPTGGILSQGEGNATVLLFGPGISSSMQASFSGPGDLTVSSIQSVTATDGTPGLQLSVAASGAAALGARTLILQDSNQDITTFSGGVEVVGP